jgi:hypothetical protein
VSKIIRKGTKILWVPTDDPIGGVTPEEYAAGRDITEFAAIRDFGEDEGIDGVTWTTAETHKANHRQPMPPKNGPGAA